MAYRFGGCVCDAEPRDFVIVRAFDVMVDDDKAGKGNSAGPILHDDGLDQSAVQYNGHG
ncbi:hypothetical protein WJ969_02690 [Achromobacter xylosoxidans]